MSLFLILGYISILQQLTCILYMGHKSWLRARTLLDMHFASIMNGIKLTLYILYLLSIFLLSICIRLFTITIRLFFQHRLPDLWIAHLHIYVYIYYIHTNAYNYTYMCIYTFFWYPFLLRCYLRLRKFTRRTLTRAQTALCCVAYTACSIRATDVTRTFVNVTFCTMVLSPLLRNQV